MSQDSLFLAWQTQDYGKDAWYEEKDRPEIAHQTSPVFPDYRERIEKIWRREGHMKSVCLADSSLRTPEEYLEVDIDSPPSWFHRITVDTLQEWFDNKVGWVRVYRITNNNPLLRQQGQETVVSFRFVKKVFGGGYDCMIAVLLASGESAMMFVIHDNVNDTFRFSHIAKRD